MTRRSKKILWRLVLAGAPFWAIQIAVELLFRLVLDRHDFIVDTGLALASFLIVYWLFLSVDEWRWAPRRRFAVLRHLYLEDAAGRQRVEEDILLGGLEVCPIYRMDLSFLEDRGYLRFSHDGEPTGDIAHDGRPKRARRCRLTPEGQYWIEHNPVMP